VAVADPGTAAGAMTEVPLTGTSVEFGMRMSGGGRGSGYGRATVTAVIMALVATAPTVTVDTPMVAIPVAGVVAIPVAVVDRGW
jgi:hypothetical protein